MVGDTVDPAPGAAVSTAPLYYLRTFHLVAQERSFTRAAQSLHLTQPAVSGHMRALERHFGAALFNVRHRRVALTAEGRALQAYTTRIFGLLAEAERAVAQTRDLERGSLALAASSTVGVYLLPPLLGRFRASYPGIQVSVQIGTSGETVALVAAEQVALALVEAPVSHPDVEAHAFQRDDLVLVAPPGHPWALAGRVTPRMLHGTPVLRREAGSGTQALLDAALARAGIIVRVALELGSPEALKQAVLAGLGVAWMPRIAVTRELAAGDLVAIETPGVDTRRSLYVVEARGGALPRAAAAFRAILDGEAPAMDRAVPEPGSQSGPSDQEIDESAENKS